MTEVLVIGAAGKTGRAVTRALVERGVGVRAAVRPGSRSLIYGDRVRAVSVELVTGSGLEAAVAGVSAIYHLAPNVHPDEVLIATRVAESALRQGVSRFAYHSVLHPDDASMPHHLRKAQAERSIRARLESATILRPAAYLQNLEHAARQGRIEVPHSLDAPFTNVDLDDVAVVAARVLTEDGHEGATYDLAGAERMSVRDMAEVATDVLGRHVEAASMSLDDWMTGPGADQSEQARHDLVAMFRSYDHGGLVGDPSALRQMLGREPRTWRDVLA
ncbi:NmrA family NAD(P)-binding protein [Knoellia sp. S7-12]|uniref:NmrA family NAD(P)-binding protein n=1 Tax=Knoellia sp. S7-12 TaxID=3126698 RepID=UPI003366284E